MRGYPSRAKTGKYFIGAVLLFVFQMLLGVAASLYFLSRDIRLPFAFDIIRALHINVMVLWLLLGFIGGLYYLLPAEVGRDIKYPWLIDVQFWFLLVVGAGIILSEMFFTGRNWWLVEGREYVEAGRLWDILLTLGLLSVAYNMGATMLERKKKINSPMLVLAAGTMGAILMYVPGEIWFDSLVAAEYFRWWVVHYWVEASFELIAAGIIALILLSMTDVRREMIEKYLAIEVALILLTGIIGQGHHYYWIGTPGFWLFLGGLFSALEPVPLFLMVWSSYKDLKENNKPIPNKIALYMIIGAAFGNLIGAGFFGFGHTLPQVNFFTHSTQITAAHAHFATPGTYLLLVLGIAYLAIPDIAGRLNFSHHRGKIGFWVLVLGFLNMIVALMISGVIQVYLQRLQGVSFIAVQNALLPFYGWRTIGGVITLAGGIIIAYDIVALGSKKKEKSPPEKEVISMFNPFYLMAFLYASMAALIALDASLTNLNLLSFFNGLRWLRVHFIVLGILAGVIFGLLPSLAAAREGKPHPKVRWDIWLTFNIGLLALLAGIPLNNTPLIYAGGTLAFVAALLLAGQLIKIYRNHVRAQSTERMFYLAGISYLLLGIIVGTGIFPGWDVSLLRIASPKELHVHANTWGFLALVFAGMLIAMYPQFTGRQFAWQRSTGAIFWLLVLGALSLVIGPWLGNMLFSASGVILNFIATVMLFLNITIPLRSDRSAWTPGMVHIIASYLWFLALALTAPFIPTVESVASQMLVYGWILQFGYALIPYLFARSAFPGEPGRLGGNWLSVVAVNTGVISLGASTLVGASGLLSGIAYALWTLSLLPIIVQLWRILDYNPTQV